MRQTPPATRSGNPADHFVWLWLAGTLGMPLLLGMAALAFGGVGGVLLVHLGLGAEVANAVYALLSEWHPSGTHAALGRDFALVTGYLAASLIAVGLLIIVLVIIMALLIAAAIVAGLAVDN